MSQADANSVAGESLRAGQTGTGCYKNHEHHMGKQPGGGLNSVPPGGTVHTHQQNEGNMQETGQDVVSIIFCFTVICR